MTFENYFLIQVLDQYGKPLALKQPLHKDEVEAHKWAEKNHEKILTDIYTIIPVKHKAEEKEEPVKTED